MIPGLIAHLWQSTVFAGTAWLLTLGLRKNSAQVRYRILFVASIKFLIPLSLLVGLGTLVPRRSAVPSVQPTWLETAEPLVTLPAVATQVAGVEERTTPDYFVAAVLAVWFCGFAAIMICWLRRWNRVRTIRKSAIPTDIVFAVPIISAPDLVEPGIVGVFRPVLLLPEGIAERLDPAQLDAILAHELCHVRRRDNLTATIHMAVQAIFWFHPLVWWLGTRLVDERERACDEEVLRLGAKPQVYATGILNVCKLYMETPLACVSGITGSNLKNRIEVIMKKRNVLRLNLAKKFALTIAGLAALAMPVLIGILNAPSARAQATKVAVTGLPKFEVASIKLFKDDGGPRNSAVYGPQGINFGGLTLAFVVGEAYEFPVGRIQGAGSLTKKELWTPLRQAYNIIARADRPVPKDQLCLMLQSLLADRFHLKLHREAKAGPVYKLVVAKSGPTLEQSQPAEVFSFSNGPAGSVFRAADMVRLSSFLSGNVDRPVVDQTGLGEHYNFTLRKPDGVRQDTPIVKSDGISTDSPSAAAFSEALRQLGLQLIADTAPVDYLVVDHVESPSEN